MTERSAGVKAPDRVKGRGNARRVRPVFALRLALVLLVVIAAGCDQESTGPRPYVDVFESSDGQIHVGQQSGYEYEAATGTSSGEVSEDGGRTWRPGSWDLTPIDQQQRHVCLNESPSTCVRFDEREVAIEETTDNGATWTTVWKLDSSEGWLIPAYGYLPYRVVIAGYDLHVLNDDTVIAAVGELPPLRRSVDGIWTPSVADIRSISVRLVASVVGAIGALALAAAFTRLKNPGYRFVQLGSGAACGALPLAIAATSLAFSFGAALLVLFLTVLAGLAMTYAVALLLIALIDLIQVRGLAKLLPAMAATIATIGALLTFYWLWSFDLIGYRSLQFGWAATALIGVYGAMRSVDNSLPEPRFEQASPGVVRAAAEGTVAMLVLYLLPIRNIEGVWLILPLTGCVVMFLRLLRFGHGISPRASSLDRS